MAVVCQGNFKIGHLTANVVRNSWHNPWGRWYLAILKSLKAYILLQFVFSFTSCDLCNVMFKDLPIRCFRSRQPEPKLDAY